MKLYIKQKVFSWTDRFSVLDADGRERYYVKGEFSLVKKLHIYTADGREAAYIEGKMWSWMPRYSVFVDGALIAEAVREFTFFRPRYRLDGPGWQIEGDFWEHDYEVLHNGRAVADIRKEWMTWGDCYELNVAQPEDEINALAVVLAIDCAMEAAAAASN